MAADIRPARASDIDALAAVERAEFPTDRISRRAFARLMRSESAALMVTGQPPRGYCVVLFRRGSSVARLYSIAVSSREGGRGEGRALLAAAEGEAVRRGRRAMRLEVREDNRRARDLYERNGYRRFDRIDGYYADGSPALRYEKPLEGSAAERGADRGTAGERSSSASASGVIAGR